MKISLNVVQRYLDFELPPVDELVERIGAQLGAVEETEELGAKYQGVIVAQIIKCYDHPDSDHMHVCIIDDGGVVADVNRDEDGHVQVVCGAPNVRDGLLVAWLPPGSTVPESVDKDPFVLSARELRGVMSNGMLASPRELALGDDHNGILEITGNAKPGDDFAKVYGLDDTLIDIENKMFTHRPDCFGMLGVAREIAGIYGHEFKSTDWYTITSAITGDNSLPLTVHNELPTLVPRFMAITLKNITVGPSPDWIQGFLSRIGSRPISNVVDITNYLMFLTGQPLHAYDYDKVKALSGPGGATLVARNPRTNETLKLLNGKTIDPRQEAIMIATDTQLIGAGGVMGGFDTEVDENTKNIILEVATFDMYSVRRTSMAHGLFTDAVSRFNKGQSPLQNEYILGQAVRLLQELAHGEIASDIIDINQLEGRAWVHRPVKVAVEFINARLGFTLSANDMATLLNNVEFDILLSEDEQSIEVSAPFWRTDIETREDIVEEIGRLYGFDKLPLVLPRRSITPADEDPLFKLKSRVRASLSKAGANEVLTYSFVHGDLFQKTGQDLEKAFQVTNALSPDLQYYRLGLTPSLLANIHANQKAGYDAFALFEIGKSHYLGEMDADEPDVPNEDTHVALVLAYSNKQQPAGAPYYHARQYLEQLIDVADINLVPLSEFDITTDAWGQQLTAPYEPNRSAVIVRDNQIWGVIGEFRTPVRRALKLPDFTAGFEIHAELITARPIQYQSLPRFPKVTQDITLQIPSKVSYRQLYDFVWESLVTLQPEQSLPTLTVLDTYQSANDLAHKHVTFRLTIASYTKTMTDDEITKILDAITAAVGQKFTA